MQFQLSLIFSLFFDPLLSLFLRSVSLYSFQSFILHLWRQYSRVLPLSFPTDSKFSLSFSPGYYLDLELFSCFLYSFSHSFFLFFCRILLLFSSIVYVYSPATSPPPFLSLPLSAFYTFFLDFHIPLSLPSRFLFFPFTLHRLPLPIGYMQFQRSLCQNLPSLLHPRFHSELHPFRSPDPAPLHSPDSAARDLTFFTSIVFHRESQPCIVGGCIFSPLNRLRRKPYDTFLNQAK